MLNFCLSIDIIADYQNIAIKIMIKLLPKKNLFMLIFLLALVFNVDYQNIARNDDNLSSKENFILISDRIL